MQMFLKGGKTFILRHFDLKCDLTLTKIVAYVFFLFSFFFARMARDTKYALSSPCNSYFLREATKTHADTKKKLQKNPTALLLDVSRNTQYYLSNWVFNDTLFFCSLQRISLTLIVVVPTRGLVMDKQIMQHQQLLDTHHKMSMNVHLTHFNRKKPNMSKLNVLRRYRQSVLIKQNRRDLPVLSSPWKKNNLESIYKLYFYTYIHRQTDIQIDR